ncbi:MAG TPA: MarR family transcriptional regulator [Pseudonocardiaceae bacterium]|jgi:DNA-binding MarR family transcriptional regulator|nr:MarR family transcriptional regulator [Pseudonocardiaceae bacterium]
MSDTGTLLWQVTLAWQRAMRATLEPHDLTHVQYVLLAATAELGEAASPPNQHVIAEHTGTEPHLAGQVLRRLAARQLITRELDETDPKARLVVLTDIGRELLAAVVRDVEITEAEFFVPLGGALAGFRGGLAALLAG